MSGGTKSAEDLERRNRKRKISKWVCRSRPTDDIVCVENAVSKSWVGMGTQPVD